MSHYPCQHGHLHERMSNWIQPMFQRLLRLHYSWRPRTCSYIGRGKANDPQAAVVPHRTAYTRFRYVFSTLSPCYITISASFSLFMTVFQRGNFWEKLLLKIPFRCFHVSLFIRYRVRIGPERTGTAFRFFFFKPERRSGSFFWKIPNENQIAVVVYTQVCFHPWQFWN